MTIIPPPGNSVNEKDGRRVLKKRRPILQGFVKQLIRPMIVTIGRIFCNVLPFWKGSLVQRELSAKLTEGLFYGGINILAHSTEVSADFIVGNTNHGKTVAFQKSGTVCISLQRICLIVLGNVQFKDELCFCTVKIGDIFSKHLLSGETDRIGT